jgi:tRNA pseudouridine13 synthase
VSDAHRWRSFRALPYAHGGPPVQGRLRASAEDFAVDEELGFAADGDGEHRLVRVRKVGANTDWVARRLAALAGVSPSAVGYAGLKDRHAVVTQWLSVPVANRPEPDWASTGSEGFEVLEVHRHRRKLRRGVLAGNRFRLLIRDVRGDRGRLDERFRTLVERGVPNYFGEQRFGHDDGNLTRATALFEGRAGRVDRRRRGLWLSAARSQLFNEVLAERVARGDWDAPLAGDRMQLAGSHSYFAAETVDAALRERVCAGDLSPTGPLWGRGGPSTTGDPARLEEEVGAAFPTWAVGLAAAGLVQERRALRLLPKDLSWDWPADDVLELSFRLPAGSYATALLRELVDWHGVGSLS